MTPAPPVSYADPTYIPGLTPALPTPPVAPSGPKALNAAARPRPVPVPETVFAWDGLVKETKLKPGETAASFTFSLTNTSATEVTIYSVRTSCGCTIAKLPAVPWTIPAGKPGTFDVVVDVRGKHGVLTKTVTIDSSAGYRHLSVRVGVPTSQLSSAMTTAERARNLQVAAVDRQAVFKGDCAACHLQPALGKKGEELYESACGVCHEAEHRASMVPNLRALTKPMEREDWQRWITEGKPGSLMPAWAIRQGGPLTDSQVESLLDYLTGPFKLAPTPARTPATPTEATAPAPAD